MSTHLDLRTTEPARTAHSCCAPEQQTSCCEPSDKEACCGPEVTAGGCGCGAGQTATAAAQGEELREVVRERYAASARGVSEGGSGCCGTAGAVITDEQATMFGAGLYDGDERSELPDTAVMASLGCGNPTAVAELREGEIVLDLGSGGGIDVLLSARRVGPTGKAYGLDMTDEMLRLARVNQAKAGVENVEWLKGHIEAIPLPDDAIDVVVSNCVINLSVDKPQVLREAARVLKPGGRFAVSDVVADSAMDKQTRADLAQYVGCIAGALTRDEYVRCLADAGFVDIEVIETHRVHEHAASAIVRARKPVAGRPTAHARRAAGSSRRPRA